MYYSVRGGPRKTKKHRIGVGNSSSSSSHANTHTSTHKEKNAVRTIGGSSPSRQSKHGREPRQEKKARFWAGRARRTPQENKDKPHPSPVSDQPPQLHSPYPRSHPSTRRRETTTPPATPKTTNVCRGNNMFQRVKGLSNTRLPVCETQQYHVRGIEVGICRWNRTGPWNRGRQQSNCRTASSDDLHAKTSIAPHRPSTPPPPPPRNQHHY